MYSISSLSLFFFFSSRRRHTRFDCDWSSDVCSSDLVARAGGPELTDTLQLLPPGQPPAPLPERPPLRRGRRADLDPRLSRHELPLGVPLGSLRPGAVGAGSVSRGPLAAGDRRVGARDRGSLRALAVQARVLRAARLPRARPPGGRRLGERARHRALARHRHAWPRRRRRLGPLGGGRAPPRPGVERARGAERVLPDPPPSRRPPSPRPPPPPPPAPALG